MSLIWTILTAPVTIPIAAAQLGVDVVWMVGSGLFWAIGGTVGSGRALRTADTSEHQLSGLYLSGWSRLSLNYSADSASNGSVGLDDASVERWRASKAMKRARKHFANIKGPAAFPTADILAHQDVFYLQLKDCRLSCSLDETQMSSGWTQTLRRKAASRDSAVMLLELSEYRVYASPVKAVSVPVIYRKMEPLVLRSLVGDKPDLFFYFASCTAKEDWYLSLRLAISRMSSEASHRLHSEKYMKHVIASVQKISLTASQTLKPLPSIAGDISTQWFNALVGRIYMSIAETEWFQSFVEFKLRNKLDKMNRPAMLGPISVRSFKLGESAPMIYNAKLVRLTPDGEVEIAFDMNYAGGFEMEIETVITIETGISAISLSVVLKVNITSIVGRIMVRMKSPPSNRLWWGFLQEPEMNVSVKPIVSDTSINFSMVMQAIDKKLRDMIRDTLVTPHMDDITLPGLQDIETLFEIIGLAKLKTEDVGFKNLLQQPISASKQHKKANSTGNSAMAADAAKAKTKVKDYVTQKFGSRSKQPSSSSLPEASTENELN